MKRRLLALLSISTLVLSLFIPNSDSHVYANSYEDWDVKKYGDRIHIDAFLNKQAQDEEFQKQAKKKIKEAAENINFNEEETSESNGDGNFSYNGGEKFFLNRDLAFKEFTLRSIGDHVEIWVANDLSFPDDRKTPVVTQEQVDQLAEEFDSNIYPVDTQFFGTPDSHDGSNSELAQLGYVPQGYYDGDGDKIIMLVDNIIDENFEDPDYPFFVAGFYWSTLEQYHDRNIITIDTNNWEERLESTFFGTTIHELQHLIHDDNDSDETSWLNEGMSTFSEYLGGYGMDEGSIQFLMDHPENSLTAWDEHYNAETGPETIADYALVQLFNLYNYEQFGKEFIREIAKSPLNSTESYQKALENNNINLDFKDVFRNFTTALLIDDPDTQNGIYGFKNYNVPPVNLESAKQYEKDGVLAWGADYKKLDFKEKIRSISFDGIDFLPIPWETVSDPLGSDNQVFWGNEGHEADNSLAFKADLTNVSNATLTFDNFIDIEENWDFGVVQVSTDEGETWTSLSNENTTTEVVEEGYPKIKESVPGFTGHYEDWKKETFDLSAYAGKDVYISFRYLTDWGYNDSGWFVDNIEIPEVGISYDGNSKEGLTNIDEIQKKYVNYGVTFINEKQDGKYKVIHVDPFNVTEDDALQLRQLFKNGDNYMTTYYAAPDDSLTNVPFQYEVEFKEKGKDKKKSQ